jgi:hypothetical protein
VRWCVIRNPELPGQTGVVAEDALPVWRPRGWIRVSAWEADQALLRPAEYADGPDLDVEPTKAPAKQPAEPSKEKP